MTDIIVREAKAGDAQAICDIFYAVYADTYAYPEYYDPDTVLRFIYNDDVLVLVAEDTNSKAILGTASVIMSVGAHNDLVGEFGRLAVHPNGQCKGIGRLLMEARINLVKDRLHMALVEPRTAHPYSQKISDKYAFVNVGFLLCKHGFERRESVALCVRYFKSPEFLRRNHPKLIPEAYRLANIALLRCEIRDDVIADDHSDVLPYYDDYTASEMQAKGYAALLHFERGRISHRYIFGPQRLHYGLFQLKASHSTYITATRDDVLEGAIGFMFDPHEKLVKVLEVISLDERCIQFLLKRLLLTCNALKAAFIEVDVSAYAPGFQRSLYALGFRPMAYIPAMVFHQVERLDVLRMGLVLCDASESQDEFIASNQTIADLVKESCYTKELS